ncbi:hypothetical protein D3C86_2013520 [compost metagenome]
MLQRGPHGVFQRGDVLLGGLGVAARGEDARGRMQHAAAVGVEEGRQQLAPRQVTGAAKQHHVEIGHAHPGLLAGGSGRPGNY